MVPQAYCIVLYWALSSFFDHFYKSFEKVNVNTTFRYHWRTLGWCVPCLLTGTNDTDVPKCVEAQ